MPAQLDIVVPRGDSHPLTITFLQSGARAISDLITDGSATVHSDTAAWTSDDVGKTFVGPGVPAGTTIESWVDASHVVLSNSLNASVRPRAAAFGTPEDLTGHNFTIMVSYPDDTDDLLLTQSGSILASGQLRFVVPSTVPMDGRWKIRDDTTETTRCEGRLLLDETEAP